MRQCSSTSFFKKKKKEKYFSPLINVSLHPKFSFSIYLVQTQKEEEHKAGSREGWQERRAGAGETRGRDECTDSPFLQGPGACPPSPPLPLHFL